MSDAESGQNSASNQRDSARNASNIASRRRRNRLFSDNWLPEPNDPWFDLYYDANISNGSPESVDSSNPDRNSTSSTRPSDRYRADPEFIGLRDTLNRSSTSRTPGIIIRRSNDLDFAERTESVYRQNSTSSRPTARRTNAFPNSLRIPPEIGFSRFFADNPAAARIHLGALLNNWTDSNTPSAIISTNAAGQPVDIFNDPETDDSNIEDSADDSGDNDDSEDSSENDDDEDLYDSDHEETSFSEASINSDFNIDFDSTSYHRDVGSASELEDSTKIDLSQKLQLPIYLLNTHFGLTRMKHLFKIKSFFSCLNDQKLETPSKISENDSSNHPNQKNDGDTSSHITQEPQNKAGDHHDLHSPKSSTLIEEFLDFISKPKLVPLREYNNFLELNYDFEVSLRFPSSWSNKDHSKNVKPESDHLTLNYTGKGREDTHAGMARTNYSIPPNCGIFYYETEIKNKGKHGYIGIGMSGLKVSLNRLPGWDCDSWGYHGDDGFSFNSNSSGRSYGPKFTKGDIIGCGVNFITSEIFFVKNGVFLGAAIKDHTYNNLLFPTVGLRTVGEQVQANFGISPFVFDIESYVHEQERKIWRTILNSDVSSLTNKINKVNHLSTDQLSKSSLSAIQSSQPPILNGNSDKVLTNQDTTSINKFLVQSSGIKSNKNSQSVSLPDNNKETNSSLTDCSAQNKKNTLTPDTYLFNLFKPSTLNSTSSANSNLLVPNSSSVNKPSTKDIINELVFSYMIHNGYNKSADSFSKNSYGITCTQPKIIKEETVSIKQPNHNKLEKIRTIERLLKLRMDKETKRKYICQLIREGKIYKALDEITLYYPNLISCNKMLIFSLRCMHFIELARVANSGPEATCNLIDEDFNDFPHFGPDSSMQRSVSSSISLSNLGSNDNSVHSGDYSGAGDSDGKVDSERMDVDDLVVNEISNSEKGENCSDEASESLEGSKNGVILKISISGSFNSGSGSGVKRKECGVGGAADSMDIECEINKGTDLETEEVKNTGSNDSNSGELSVNDTHSQGSSNFMAEVDRLDEEHSYLEDSEGYSKLRGEKLGQVELRYVEPASLSRGECVKEMIRGGEEPREDVFSACVYGAND
ncbi:Ran-binding protein 9 [Smittium culicis]|uniref:Ran-binding protein 9 n=1 Tax=Smittium culicis TaxID=133412 RepID=A0A1R1XJ34_9FUNG|nr:Ran-binding protein 9 [Smittium culicis]